MTGRIADLGRDLTDNGAPQVLCWKVLDLAWQFALQLGEAGCVAEDWRDRALEQVGMQAGSLAKDVEQPGDGPSLSRRRCGK